MWKYVEQVKEAIKTGSFYCIAHPDLPNVTCSDAAIRNAARVICAAAMEEGIPVPTGEVVPMISPLAVVFGEVTE